MNKMRGLGMKKRIDPAEPEKSEKEVVDEALDSLNAEARERGARETQKHIEAHIEEEARNRRESEKPARAVSSERDSHPRA